MRQILSIFLIVLLSTVMVGRGTKTRTKASVKKEKTELTNKINQTQKKIKSNRANTARLLSELNTLQAQIQLTGDTIRRINSVIDSLTVRERLTSDSISRTEAQIAALENECARQLRTSRRHRKSMSNATLLLSSPSISQAVKRTAYIKQLNRTIVRKSTNLDVQRRSLEDKRRSLADMREQQQRLAQNLAYQQQQLSARQVQTNTLVDGLKREGDALAAVLQDQRALSQRLDNELNSIIAEEKRRADEQRQAEQRKKAAEKQTSKKTAPSADAPTTRPKRQRSEDSKKAADSPKPADRHTKNFAANKGRMMFPVSGKYTIVRAFGVSKRDDLPYVQTDNSGIDIKSTGAGTAVSVFDGTVSSIFYIDGFHNVVMVRHGEYLTVYAGLDKLNVKKGDKVAAGQSLGQIHNGENGAVLHFEVRRETQKLNPLEWVRR